MKLTRKKLTDSCLCCINLRLYTTKFLLYINFPHIDVFFIFRALLLQLLYLLFPLSLFFKRCSDHLHCLSSLNLLLLEQYLLLFSFSWKFINQPGSIFKFLDTSHQMFRLTTTCWAYFCVKIAEILDEIEVFQRRSSKFLGRKLNIDCCLHYFIFTLIHLP